jgi:hypothetical protein
MRSISIVLKGNEGQAKKHNGDANKIKKITVMIWNSKTQSVRNCYLSVVHAYQWANRIGNSTVMVFLEKLIIAQPVKIKEPESSLPFSH